MLSILIAIVGLGLLVVLHEGGHFVAARLCGMRVERFSIGFGPTLFGFRRGGTLYQVAPIPLGGFVQITGLNPNEEFDATDPSVYPNRPRWMRLATVVAGPAANYLTAVVIMLVVFLAYGVSKYEKVIDTLPSSPAAMAGLQPNDVLMKADGQPLSVDDSIRGAIQKSQGRPIVLEVMRGGQPATFTLHPERKPSGEYQVGVRLGQSDPSPLPAVQAVGKALVFPVKTSGAILNGLWKMVTGKEKAELSGPIGITRQIAKAAQSGPLDYFYLLALLSVYLGLFNLLPLPALDGGRALFLGVEAVTRRRVNPRIEAAVHTVGLVVLLGVLVVVSFKDVFGHG